MSVSYGFLRSLVIYRARPGRGRRLIEHYRPFIREGQPAFDLGAHVGSRSLAFARLGARVVAVEPMPDMAAFLRFVFRRRSSVAVEECAVGTSEGTTELYICRRNPTLSTTSRDWRDRSATVAGFSRFTFDKTVSVEQTTLDRLIERYGEPSFIKIDVEGSEDEVLAGLSRPVEALSFEFLPQDREVALRALARIEALGTYRYNVSLGETVRMAWGDRWCDVGELRAYIDEIPNDGPSGDIYARLDTSATLLETDRADHA